jgi:hypothetical protein
MRVRIGRIPYRWKDATSWMLISGVIGLWLAARILTPAAGGAKLRGVWLPSCPLRALTGIPCPLCGITTGCAWLAHGDLSHAWRSNILSPLLMFTSVGLGIYVIAVRMAAGRVIHLDSWERSRKALWILACCAVVASWIVNLCRLIG